MRRIFIAAGILFAASAGACDDGAGPGTAAPGVRVNKVITSAPTPADSKPDEAIDTIGTSAPTVNLLEPGAEPRRGLAFTPTAGKRTVEMSWLLVQPGMPPEATTTMRLALSWARPAEAGGPWGFSVASAGPESFPVGASDAEKEIIGKVFAMFGTVAGHVVAHSPAHIEVIQTRGMPTQPSLTMLLHMAAIPFPPEAVGVGAKWEVEQAAADGEMTGTEKRVYELVALEGNVGTIRVTGEQHLSRDATARPMPGPIAVDSTLEGEWSFELADLMPTRGRATTGLKMRMAVGPPPGPGAEGKEMVMEATGTLTIGAVEPESTPAAP